MYMSETQNTSTIRSFSRILVHIGIGGAMGIVFPGVYQALGATESQGLVWGIFTAVVLIVSVHYAVYRHRVS